MKNPINGRCFCGRVKFNITPPTEFSAHCHCESCRLSHGAPFVTWTGVPWERFSFVQGEENVKWHKSSEWISWGFCKECGSSMFYRVDKEGHHESPKIDVIYISVGSLTDQMDRKPKAHVSYEERIIDVKRDGKLPKYKGKKDEEILE
jgi:hypothetical protein